MMEKRKSVMFIGMIGCGKTTLCQRLAGQEYRYKKTQAVEVIDLSIDTPGEYLENKKYLNALVVTAAEAEVVAFVADATRKESCFSPHQADMFYRDVIGVVTKTDIATEEEKADAEEILKRAGVVKIFCSPDPEKKLEQYLNCQKEEEEAAK